MKAFLRVRAIVAAGVLATSTMGAPAMAQSDRVAADGTVRIDGAQLPVSDQLSPEAQAYVRHLLVDHPFAGGPTAEQDIAGYRAQQDKIMRTFLDPIRVRYKVRVEEQTIGGVRTDVVTPVQGVSPQHANRVLINVHGGGFTSGARTAALVESIPIAATMGIKVISVDYRMFPEHKFPAASEDLAAVYAQVLKTHQPNQIGIFGCSAGGVLTAQAIGWFRAHALPLPGAIGVLCAPLGKFVGGDAAALGGALNGFGPRSGAARPARPARSMFGYMADAAETDPLAYPIVSPALLAAFPPTILVTGGRSMEFSTVVTSHNALVKAGVDAELHVWDGLMHAFMYNSELPESREVYAAVARFFERHLAP